MKNLATRFRRACPRPFPARLSLMEAGFLVGLFFTPWAPVPRYLGWALALAGVAAGEGRQASEALPRGMKAILSCFLAWSAFVTILSVREPAAFVQGFSNPLEIAFGIWLGAKVLSDDGARRRATSVFLATTVLAAAWSVFCYGRVCLFGGRFGPLGNLNTAGHCGLLMFGFWAAVLAGAAGKTGSPHRWAGFAGTVCGGVVLFLGFSSLAWLSGGAALLALAALRARAPRACLKLAAALAATATVAGLLLFFPGASLAGKSLDREIHQMSAVKNPETFTNRRSDIWLRTLPAVADRPWTGHGWGQFESALPRYWAVRNVRVPVINSPHNLFLEALFDGGFPLLVLFLLLFASVWLSAAKLLEKDGARVEALAAVALLAAEALYSMGGSVVAYRASSAPLLWVLAGCVSGMAGRETGKNPPLP